MGNTKALAEKLHERVEPGFYWNAIPKNILRRYWHKRRFEEIKKLIKPIKGNVIDVGSADGVFSKVILDKSGARKLIGIDVLESSVKWANKHWEDSRMKFITADAHNLPFKNNIFSAGFALEVLEHVSDPKKVLSEIYRVIKKGSYAVFLVPSDNFLFRLLWPVWLKTWGRMWDHTHIQTYRSGFLPKLCKKVGFKIEVEKRFILGMLHAVRVVK